MLIVLETAKQAVWYRENRSRFSERAQVLAITPTAALACQDLGEHYLKIEDHCSYAQRFGEYSTTFKNFLAWEAALDNRAVELVPDFGAAGFRPANAVTFLLQLLHAEVWVNARNLHEVFASLLPEAVAFWSPQTIEVPAFLQPQVAPAVALLPSMQFTAAPEIIDITREHPELAPGAPSRNEAGPMRLRLKNRLKQTLRESNLFAELEALRLHGPSLILDYFSRQRPRILTDGFGYDLEPLILELRRCGAQITRLKDNSNEVLNDVQAPGAFAGQLAEAWPIVREEFAVETLKSWGVGEADLFIKPLHFWWHQLVPVLWKRFQRARALMSARDFTALITLDCGATSWGGPAVQAASVLNLPRYTYQHGGSAGRDARTWQMYLRGSDTFLTAGEGTVRDLEESRPPFLTPSAKVVPVGSGMLDKVRSRYSETKVRRLREELKGRDPRPIVLYIPTTFGQYGRAVSDIAPYAEVSYLELQQEALRVWLEASGVRLLYKNLVVANDPNRVMPDFIQKQIPNGTVTTRRVTDLMWAVDAIVVDHAVTALNEVLLTNKPMLVYLPPLLTLDPAAKTILQKRATVAETPSDFINAIREFLRPQRFSTVQSPNNDFLSLYGTFLNDGRSTQRAAAVILEGNHREFRRTQL